MENLDEQILALEEEYIDEILRLSRKKIWDRIYTVSMSAAMGSIVTFLGIGMYLAYHKVIPPPPLPPPILNAADYSSPPDRVKLDIGALTAEQLESIDYSDWKYSGHPKDDLVVYLREGEVLFVSGTQYDIEGESCQGDSSRVCVYIREAQEDEVVSIEGLIPSQTWVGVASHMDIEEVYTSRMPSYWMPLNCGVGCNYADVTLVEDTASTVTLSR